MEQLKKESNIYESISPSKYNWLGCSSGFRGVGYNCAIRKFNAALTNIIATYPIGISGSDVSSLSAANIYEVDEFRKKAKGFDLWLLDRLAITGSSSSNPNAEANVIANATNQGGDLVPLIHIVRGVY